MSKYHPIDVRYKGPSTAYRGASVRRDRQSSFKAQPRVRRVDPLPKRDRTFVARPSLLRRIFWLYRVISALRAWAILILMAGVVLYAFYVDIMLTFFE